MKNGNTLRVQPRGTRQSGRRSSYTAACLTGSCCSCCSCDAAPYAVRGRSCFMVHCNRACGVRAYCKLSQKLVSTGILQCARILHLPQSRSKGRIVVIKKIYSGESGTNTVCPGRSIINLYSKLLYKMWHYFWDIQYLGFYR